MVRGGQRVCWTVGDRGKSPYIYMRCRRTMRNLATVGRDMGATGRGEDLVAGSVVGVVVARADTHMWAYI